jgi:hypothetical protein
VYKQVQLLAIVIYSQHKVCHVTLHEHIVPGPFHSRTSWKIRSLVFEAGDKKWPVLFRNAINHSNLYRNVHSLTWFGIITAISVIKRVHFPPTGPPRAHQPVWWRVYSRVNTTIMNAVLYYWQSVNLFGHFIANQNWSVYGCNFSGGVRVARWYLGWESVVVWVAVSLMDVSYCDLLMEWAERRWCCTVWETLVWNCI